MSLESSRYFIEHINLDVDKEYITLHLPIDEYQIDEEKIFTYFKESKGSRYWFKSKDNTYNVIGINYIDSIWRDRFVPKAVEDSKAALFNKIQQEALSENLKSKLSLFGGTLFDDKSSTDEWNDFKMVEFHLPEWQFDLKNQELFLTRPIKGLVLEELIEEISGVLAEIETEELYERDKPVVKSKQIGRAHV